VPRGGWRPGAGRKKKVDLVVPSIGGAPAQVERRGRPPGGQSPWWILQAEQAGLVDGRGLRFCRACRRFFPVDGHVAAHVRSCPQCMTCQHCEGPISSTVRQGTTTSIDHAGRGGARCGAGRTPVYCSESCRREADWLNTVRVRFGGQLPDDQLLELMQWAREMQRDLRSRGKGS